MLHRVGMPIRSSNGYEQIEPETICIIERKASGKMCNMDTYDSSTIVSFCMSFMGL